MQSEELSPEELSAVLTSYMPEIPGYRVIRRIGKGGMSFVYLGVQISLDRQVAIKVMSPEALKDEKSKARFEQEAHTIAKLEHPCIVGVHEVGRTPQGLLYYVLPYLARGHLGQRDFSNDEPRILEVLRALLSALEYAHTRGIVHRDVKAENVLFDNADRPLLTDFGIALSRGDTSRITTAGMALGSGGYMAPEQARGEAVDGRADLYSVGVLAFELLTGRLPYLSPDALSLAIMHAQDPIPRLPPERKHWQGFIDRAMAKAPDNRFRNAQQMLAALSHLAVRERTSTTATPHPPLPSHAPLPLLHRPWLRPALFALAAASVLVMTSLLLRSPTPPAPVASSEFFTGREESNAIAAAAQPSTVPAPTVTASLDAATDAPDPAPDAVEAIPPAAMDLTVPDEPLPVTTPFAKVQTSVSVKALEFDPSVAGARELHAVPRQIKANHLSTPAGDNAVASLQAARLAGAPAADLERLGAQIISAMSANIVSALTGGRDENARTAYKRAADFARASGQEKSEAWKKLRGALAPPLLARLDKAARNSDPTGFEGTRALARTLEVPSTELEPAWSRTVEAPRPGKVLRSSGPTTVLVQPGGNGRPGVAFMREEVSRADYAAFVRSTQRPVTRCRNRLAPITIKKRTWTDPGFPQNDNHPAVCVSYADAHAYAQWLSSRTGETFRLPSAAEWRQIANYKGSGKACEDGRVNCGQDGTAPVSSGPASPLGLVGVRGNAREWLSDCAGGCRQHLVSGLGWRDSAGNPDPIRSSGFDASVGFDDVGFRLVREVSPN